MAHLPEDVDMRDATAPQPNTGLATHGNASDEGLHSPQMPPAGGAAAHELVGGNSVYSNEADDDNRRGRRGAPVTEEEIDWSDFEYDDPSTTTSRGTTTVAPPGVPVAAPSGAPVQENPGSAGPSRGSVQDVASRIRGQDLSRHANPGTASKFSQFAIAESGASLAAVIAGPSPRASAPASIIRAPVPSIPAPVPSTPDLGTKIDISTYRQFDKKRGRDEVPGLIANVKRSKGPDHSAKPNIPYRDTIRQLDALEDDDENNKAINRMLAEPNRYRLKQYPKVADYRLTPQQQSTGNRRGGHNNHARGGIYGNSRGGSSGQTRSDRGGGRNNKSKKEVEASARDWQDIQDYEEGTHVLQSFQDDVNFVYRPGNKGKTLLIKIEKDEQVMEDMKTTLLQAAQAANANILQLHVELLTSDVAAAHREHALKAGKLTAPCIGCSSMKHRSDQCSVPDAETGYCLVNCPVCFSLDHYIDTCPKLEFDKVAKILYHNRINKARYISGWFDPAEFIPDRLDAIGKSEAEIVRMSSDKTWKEDIRHMILPWSVDFAKKIAAAVDEDDPILQGKGHPYNAQQKGKIEADQFASEPRAERMTFESALGLWLEDFVYTADVTKFPARLGFPKAQRLVPPVVREDCLSSEPRAWAYLGHQFTTAFKSIGLTRGAVIGSWDEKEKETVYYIRHDPQKLKRWQENIHPVPGMFAVAPVAPQAAPASGNISIDIVSLGIFSYSFKGENARDPNPVLSRTPRTSEQVYSFNVESLLRYINQWLDEFQNTGKIFGQVCDQAFDLHAVARILFGYIHRQWVVQSLTAVNPSHHQLVGTALSQIVPVVGS